MAKKGLGRGLSALLSDNQTDLPENEKHSDGSLLLLHLSDIEPNRKQARKRFDESALAELSDSIAQHGLLEPIVVRRRENGYYEIIAGERRWRASRMAGLNEIPALVRELDDREAALLSLIENLQREDLNPVEEAAGYRDLMEQFSLTQEEAAQRVGKSRASVANLLRLLKLPKAVLTLVESGQLSYGHARALLPLAERMAEEPFAQIAERVAESGQSVRQTEAMVRSLLSPAPQKEKEKDDPVQSDYFRSLERRISSHAGRKVSIKREEAGSGKLLLSFSSSDDLEELIRSLCGNDFFEETEESF